MTLKQKTPRSIMPVQLFLLFIMLYTVLSVPTAYFTQPSSSSVSSSPSSSLTDTQHGQNSQANQQKYLFYKSYRRN
uniref:Uncharacterized protein n=1 Tax=Trichobilharzia regenti TaxID=157069 RepID=A0AA85K0F9_TRIRE|nr:unnamed protein product [Trichobilharzia regenti]